MMARVCEVSSGHFLRSSEQDLVGGVEEGFLVSCHIRNSFIRPLGRSTALQTDDVRFSRVFACWAASFAFGSITVRSLSNISYVSTTPKRWSVRRSVILSPRVCKEELVFMVNMCCQEACSAFYGTFSHTMSSSLARRAQIISKQFPPSPPQMSFKARRQRHGVLPVCLRWREFRAMVEKARRMPTVHRR